MEGGGGGSSASSAISISIGTTISPVSSSTTPRHASEAAGQPVAVLRDEAQRLHGEGALALFAVGAELFVRREPTGELLTATQAAERLGVNASRVRALIAAGRLDAQKIGRDWLIEEHALDAVAERKPGRPKRAHTHARRLAADGAPVGSAGAARSRAGHAQAKPPLSGGLIPNTRLLYAMPYNLSIEGNTSTGDYNER